MKPDDFIKTIAEAAQKSAAATGVPAGFTIAQGALESAWGSSRLATEGKNLFGVKADKSWTGDTLIISTRECFNGKWCVVDAKWRKYPDWLSCLNDHADFFHKNPRYAKAFLTKNSEEFAKAIAAVGYATDPAYSDKLIATIRARKLSAYDDVK